MRVLLIQLCHTPSVHNQFCIFTLVTNEDKLHVWIACIQELCALVYWHDLWLAVVFDCQQIQKRGRYCDDDIRIVWRSYSLVYGPFPLWVWYDVRVKMRVNDGLMTKPRNSECRHGGRLRMAVRIYFYNRTLRVYCNELTIWFYNQVISEVTGCNAAKCSEHQWYQR